MDLPETLQEKGWTKREVNASMKIFSQAEKSPFNIFMERWMIILVIFLSLFGIFAASIFLIPLLMFLESSFLFFVIVTMLGLTVGVLLNFLFYQMDSIDKKHHLAYFLILPTAASSSMVLITNTTNNFLIAIEFTRTLHHPALVAGVFTISLLLPYLYTLRSFRSQKK